MNWLKGLMIRLERWQRARRNAKRAGDYERGYNWAFEQLDNNVAVGEIEALCHNPFDGDTHFDKGARAALRDYEIHNMHKFKV